MLTEKVINTDLCVVGGGMAGICVAVSAARAGIKVVLMQERPVLGGNASSEIRMWVCGSHGTNNRETGIIEEIMLENLHRNPTKNYYIWDTVLYDFVIREKNITLLLNCTCMDAHIKNGSYKDGRNILIESVRGYQMTTQTFFDIKAKFYSDCSGDSILAPLTNAEYMIGRESKSEFGEDTRLTEHDDYTMGISCLIQGRETTKKINFIAPPFSKKLTDSEVENRYPDLNKSYENFWYLELGGNRDTIGETEDITRELIPLATGMWDYIKNSKKFDAEKWELEFLGFLPGKRESRRMIGEYIITQRDIMDGVVFDDVIAYGGWPLDDHIPLGFYYKGAGTTTKETPAPYTIAYRALYSKNVENLFFAGRNISMTHLAMSSVRVMATCALLGQAVGNAAAIAVKNSLTPNEVYKEKIAELQEMLMNQDCFLPFKKRAISNSCIKNGKYPELCNGEDRPNRIYNSSKCGISISNNTPIEYIFNTPEKISVIHIVFDSDLNRETLPGNRCEQTHNLRCNVPLDAPQMCVPKTLCRNFILEVVLSDGTKMKEHFENNVQRAYHININKTVKKITLVLLSNWGKTENTKIFSFDYK